MPITVESYADIAGERIPVSAKDAIVDELNRHAGRDDRLIAHVPEWIIDGSDVETVGNSNVISSPIEYETEKAYLIDPDEWLPKSVITRFVAPADARISSPQRTLADVGGEN